MVKEPMGSSKLSEHEQLIWWSIPRLKCMSWDIQRRKWDCFVPDTDQSDGDSKTEECQGREGKALGRMVDKWPCSKYYLLHNK